MKSYNILYDKGIIDPDSNNYVWISNMIFLKKDKIQYYLTKIYDEMIDVVPFAKTSGGDVFGWYNKDGIKSDIVVMCHHDDGESIFYAPDLCSAIFRRILEFVNEEEFTQINNNNGITVEELHTTLLKYISVFSPFFKEKYIEVIKDLLSMPLKIVDDGCGYKYYALLTNQELDDLISENIDFGDLNKEFNCYD